MSKPVKELVKKDIQKRLEGVTSLAVVGFTGIDGVTTHSLRSRLRNKKIRMIVVKNSVARRAFLDMRMDLAARALEGPCALVYGADPEVGVVTIVRELLEARKDAPSLTVKAAVLDGELFGKDRIQELSRYPTRTEAIGRVVGLALSPGGRLAACLRVPGGRIVSILKTIEEKRSKETPPPAEAPVAEAAAPAAQAAPEAAQPPAESPAAAAPAPEAKQEQQGEAGQAPANPKSEI